MHTSFRCVCPGIIALICSFFTSSNVTFSYIQKIFGIVSVSSFVVSIIIAAMLLLILPEISQRLRPGVNIWMTEDSIAGRIFRMNTQSFAILESLFFIIGVLSVAALIFTIILTK